MLGTLYKGRLPATGSFTLRAESAGQQRGTLHIVLVHSDAAALTASLEAQKLEPRAAATVATLLQQGSSAAASDNPELLIAIVAQVSPGMLSIAALHETVLQRHALCL